MSCLWFVVDSLPEEFLSDEEFDCGSDEVCPALNAEFFYFAVDYLEFFCRDSQIDFLA